MEINSITLLFRALLSGKDGIICLCIHTQMAVLIINQDKNFPASPAINPNNIAAHNKAV